MFKRLLLLTGVLILGLTSASCARNGGTPTSTPVAPAASVVPALRQPTQTPSAAAVAVKRATATPMPQQATVQPTATAEIFVRSGRLTGSADVRLEPDQAARVLGQLPAGASIIATGISGEWFEIIYGGGPGGHGWVPQAVVTFELATATPAPSPTAVAVAVAPETATTPTATPSAKKPAASAPKPSAPKLGGKLVFQTQNGGAIYIMNSDGSGQRRLTTGFEPALSPDGSQVAFTRWDEPRGLWLVNTDGSNERLVFGANRARSPTWTPDGRTIVFERATGGLDCRLVPYLGCIPEEQLYLMLGGDCGDLGPLGNVCVGDFAGVTLWDTTLTSYDAASSEVRDLPASKTAKAPSQNPVDASVLFLDNDGFGVTRNEGNEPPVRIVQAPNLLAAAQYSPDGRFIYGSRKSHDHWDIWRWQADGSQAIALTAPPALRDRPINNVSPAVSPDGRFVAFLTDRTGKWEIWVMNADGSDQRPLAPDALGGVDLTYAFVTERMIDWGL